MFVRSRACAPSTRSCSVERACRRASPRLGSIAISHIATEVMPVGRTTARILSNAGRAQSRAGRAQGRARRARGGSSEARRSAAREYAAAGAPLRPAAWTIARAFVAGLDAVAASGFERRHRDHAAVDAHLDGHRRRGRCVLRRGGCGRRVRVSDARAMARAETVPQVANASSTRRCCSSTWLA